jgi:hypothetical protein
MVPDGSRVIPVYHHPYFTRIVLEDISSGARWEWKREAHGSSWKMVEPIEWPANPFFIDQWLSDLALWRTLDVQEALLFPEKSFNSEKRLSFFSASDGVSLECDESYIWDKERKYVFPLPKDWKAMLNPSLKDILITKLWDWDFSEIDEMMLEFPKKEKKYIFSKQEGVWIAKESESSALSTQKVNHFLSLLSKLEVDQFLPEQLGNAFALGFQVPDCRLTLLSGREPHILEIGKSFYKKSRLRFAKLVPYETIFALPCDFLHDLSDPYHFFAEEFLEETS